MIGSCVIAPRGLPLCHDLRATAPAGQSQRAVASREGEDLVEVYEHGLTTDRCIALSDAELIERTYDVISKVADGDVGEWKLGDALFFLVGEITERFAPEAARAEVLRHWHDANADDLLDALEGLRRRQAARLLRDTMGTRDA